MWFSLIPQMYKTAALLFLCVVGAGVIQRRKRESVSNLVPTKWKYQPSDFTDIQIDARLHNISQFYPDSKQVGLISNQENPTGVVEILHSRLQESLYLCYPENLEDYKQAYIVSHVICRQLGFMSLVTLTRRKLPSSVKGKGYFGLKPTSSRCTGKEQKVSHCRWNATFGDCQTLTEISCGECRNTAKSSSGILTSPGYPVVYLSGLTCEWEIIVPEGSFMLLSFYHLGVFETEMPLGRSCKLDKPYVEVTYGIQTKLNFHRYCSEQEIQNLSIPFHEAKIRVFTGFYSDEELNVQRKGFAVSFEAMHTVKSSGWVWKTVFLFLSIMIFVAITFLCYYGQKYRICNLRKRTKTNCDLPIHNAPTIEDLNRAYEFQRCNIQHMEKSHGLRLRSNGSGTKSRTFFPNTAGTVYEVPRVYRHHMTQNETPKTAIPLLILNDGQEELEMPEHPHRVRVNLLDKYSLSDSSNTSQLVETPVESSFQIYHSISSETSENEEIKFPRETSV